MYSTSAASGFYLNNGYPVACPANANTCTSTEISTCKDGYFKSGTGSSAICTACN